MNYSNTTTENKVNLNNIPVELKALDNWCLWHYVTRDGETKPTKVPLDARRVAENIWPIWDCHAASNNPNTWATFDEARATYERFRSSVDGLGFFLSRPLVGLDWDNVGDDIPEDIRRDLRRLDTYTEISPSGNGVRAFVVGEIPDEYRYEGREGCKDSARGFEIYQDVRFLTVTGNAVSWTNNKIVEAQAGIESLCRKYFGDRPEKKKRATESRTSASSLTVNDERILSKLKAAKNAEKFLGLWNADEKYIANHVRAKADGTPDWSSAVQSLLGVLAFYTGDGSQLDRLFRQSKLFSATKWGEKWERLGETEVARALAGVGERYNWRADEQQQTRTAEVEAEELLGNAEDFLLAMAEDLQPVEPVADEPQPVAVAQPQSSTETTYKFGGITSAELENNNYRMAWLVKGVLVSQQPVIFGGPKKSLKTNILTDLTLSIATGTPFLGKWEVPTPKRVAFLSGESGEFTIQETARRIARSKGLRLAEVENAFWDFRLPRLSVDAELVELARGIVARKIEVVIIDPLYLCLLSGGENTSASNLYDMGPLLAKIAEACKTVGAQPILAHHARKQNPLTAGQPLELEDLAFAGIQEFARQWILVSRRRPYEAGCPHELWLSSGGSVGHGGTWAVDVDEGQLADDFSGRVWSVEVLSRAEDEQRKADTKATQEAEAETKLDGELVAFLGRATEPLTKNALREALGWYKPKFERSVARLIASGAIRLETTKINGRPREVVRLNQEQRYATV